MSDRPALAGFLFGDPAGDKPESLRDSRRLLRRLLLAELVAPPPALRKPGTRTPLSPLADRQD